MTSRLPTTPPISAWRVDYRQCQGDSNRLRGCAAPRDTRRNASFSIRHSDGLCRSLRVYLFLTVNEWEVSFSNYKMNKATIDSQGTRAVETRLLSTRSWRLDRYNQARRCSPRLPKPWEPLRFPSSTPAEGKAEVDEWTSLVKHVFHPLDTLYMQSLICDM